MPSLFYSYSHKDKDYRDELASHLAMLRHDGTITEWHDGMIQPGDHIDESILVQLETADVILLLVSADFLASPYCYSIEMTRALERYKLSQARVIPVIVRPCDWFSAPFGRLNAVPADGTAISLWPNKDSAYLQVVQAIRRALTTPIVPKPKPAAEPIDDPIDEKKANETEDKSDLLDKDSKTEQDKTKLVGKNDDDPKPVPNPSRNKVATFTALGVVAVIIIGMLVHQVKGSGQGSATGSPTPMSSPVATPSTPPPVEPIVFTAPTTSFTMTAENLPTVTDSGWSRTKWVQFNVDNGVDNYVRYARFASDSQYIYIDTIGDFDMTKNWVGIQLDGNNDGGISGSPTPPHGDIQLAVILDNQGYTIQNLAYIYAASIGSNTRSATRFTDSADYSAAVFGLEPGSKTTRHEMFRVSLADIAKKPGDSVNFRMFVEADPLGVGTTYWYPKIDSTPAEWVQISIGQ